MMDADAMYPGGFHPVKLSYTPDRSSRAAHITRAIAGVKYYFVDFGISVHTSDTSSPTLVTGSDGRDQDPPELSDDDLYDPFKLDIFIIGNMFDREFRKEFSNLEFFKPLVEVMTSHNQEDRPDANGALALWKEIRGSLWAFHLEWRPRPREEHPLGTALLDAISLRQLIVTFTKSIAERIHV